MWHHKGQILLTRNNLPDALAHLSKAAELEPGYAIANATKWYISKTVGMSQIVPDYVIYVMIFILGMYNTAFLVVLVIFLARISAYGSLKI